MSAKPLKEPLKEPERESARPHRLPDDFRLDDQTHNWALGLLGSNDAVQQSMFRFANHYRSASGDKAKSPDWQAKARIWIDDDARNPRHKPDKSVHSAAKRLHAKISAFDAGPVVDAMTDKGWEGVLSLFVKTGRWTNHVDQCGPSPPSPDCRAPLHLLEKYNIKLDAEEAAA